MDTANTKKKKYKVWVKNKNKKNLTVISSIKKEEKKKRKKKKQQQRKPKKRNGIIVHSNSTTSINTSSVNKINTITKPRWNSPGATVPKNPPASAGDIGSVSGLGRLHMSQGN